MNKKQYNQIYTILILSSIGTLKTNTNITIKELDMNINITQKKELTEQTSVKKRNYNSENGEKQTRLGLGRGRQDGTGQRKMDASGPRAQRGECINSTSQSGKHRRLGLGRGRQDGTGQRKMDGSGPRAQRGECINK